MLARIQQEHQSYRNMELTKIKESISSESGSLSMDRLVSLYNETFSFTLPSVDYEEWIETVETPSLPDKAEVATILAKLATPPVISVVMPVYNPVEIYLRACLDSVIAQSYPYWSCASLTTNHQKSMFSVYCVNTKLKISVLMWSTVNRMGTFRQRLIAPSGNR